MNRSILPLVAAWLGLALTGCESLVTSAAQDSRDSTKATAPVASRTWILDFESGQPDLRTESSFASPRTMAGINDLSPISGRHDLRLSAILPPSDPPAWAAIWLPVAGNQAVDARKAIGFRFKAKSDLSRPFTLMLDSDAYPSAAVRYALTLVLSPRPCEYSAYFSQFSYSPRLTQPGGPCSSQGGDPALCKATLVEVVSRLRALHGFLVARSSTTADTASIQLDDFQLLYEDQLDL